MPLTIDAHQHFWQLGQPFNYRWLDAPALAAIRRDYLPEDLEPHLRAVGSRPHDRRADPARPPREPLGARPGGAYPVHRGRCRLGRPGERRLRAAAPRSRAIIRSSSASATSRRTSRTTTSSSATTSFAASGVLETHGVPFDLLFYVKHLRHAATLACALPDLPMVIDHLAQAADQGASHRRLAPRLPGRRRRPERLLQALRHGHRGRLGALDRRRPQALRPRRARCVRTGPAHVRLGLARLRAGRRYAISRSTRPSIRPSALSAIRNARSLRWNRRAVLRAGRLRNPPQGMRLLDDLRRLHGIELIASSPLRTSPGRGRTARETTRPSRRKTSVGQSLTRNERPSG